jgi:hypothetical protein
MRKSAVIVVFFMGLLIFIASVRAQLTFDSHLDSVRVDTLASNLDTFAFAPDSLHHTRPISLWILPMSMIAATGAAILLLFTTRSR